jgi:NAD(P)H-nitrite reductase large subunit
MNAAYGLINSAAAVHIVEMANHIIPVQLDSRVAKKYQARFNDEGVTFHLSRKVVAVTQGESNHIASLDFDDNTTLPCDMLIVCAGNRPNTDFLENSGIKHSNGVVVGEHMLTSATDVYAAGDVTGIATNWYAAVKQGRVAGFNMANHGNIEYKDKFHAASTMNYFGMTAMSIGKVTPPFDDCEVLDYHFEGKDIRLVMKSGIAVGVLLFGDISNAGHWKYVVQNAVPLDKLGKSPVLAEYADFFEIDQRTGEFRYKAC